MFGAKRIAEIEAALVQLQTAHNALIADAAALRQRAFIIGIERTGRVNKFTFARNGQIHVIETYGTLADDVHGWRKDLGLDE